MGKISLSEVYRCFFVCFVSLSEKIIEEEREINLHIKYCRWYHHFLFSSLTARS